MNIENIQILESETSYTQGFLTNPTPIIHDITPIDTHWVLEQALEVGLTIDEENYRLYLRTMKKTNNPGARQLLKELIEDTSNHRKEMQNVYESILRNPKEKPTGVGGLADLQITDSLENRPLNPDSTIQDVLIAASKLENLAYDYFKVQASGTGDETISGIWARFAELKLRRKLRLEREYDNVVLREN